MVKFEPRIYLSKSLNIIHGEKEGERKGKTLRKGTISGRKGKGKVRMKEEKGKGKKEKGKRKREKEKEGRKRKKTESAMGGLNSGPAWRH